MFYSLVGRKIVDINFIAFVEQVSFDRYVVHMKNGQTFVADSDEFRDLLEVSDIYKRNFFMKELNK